MAEVINDWQFVEAVMAARTLEEVAQVNRRAMRAMGFNHGAYVLKRPVPAPRADAPAQDALLFFHHLPADWARSRYESLRSNAGEQADARVQHVRAGMPATAWSWLGQVSHTRADIGQRARGLLRSAGEHGLKAGLTVPLWTPGIDWAFMTLTTDATADLRELRATLAPMNYFASCLHSTVRRLQGDAKVPVLSARQREVLHWVAVGKSTWEISEILHISERTVYFHLVSAARKLDTQGRTATCARALALGLLTP
ncbi:helix-turn-helix transcriptional regulator [Variovorax paradoxus]|nr:LuxR C-terminal-related transcriptional regulator [Variovorax paradoxus]